MILNGSGAVGTAAFYDGTAMLQSADSFVETIKGGNVALNLTIGAGGVFANQLGTRVSARLGCPLVAAFALSAAMHGMAISVFALIGAGLDLGLDAATLLAIVPLAIIASMLPIAVAGLGPREAALVVMLGPLGVAQGEALALSLCYWAVLIFIAAMGGLVQLVWGVDLPHAGEAG